MLRAELRRLFRWLKDQGVTAIITAERGDGALTRHGLEEYVSDCVILLDHRVADQVATRRLRVVKYRGASHGTNEYPFLIDADGISVLPVTSIELAHQVSTERVSTGVAGLDAMLGGKGFWRGSSILVSGMAGTGKTTPGGAFRRRRLPARRARDLFRLRGKPASDRAQHALGRRRPAAMGRRRAVALFRLASDPLGARDASRAHAQGGGGVRSASGCGRSDLQSQRRRLRHRGPADAAAAHRLPQEQDR